MGVFLGGVTVGLRLGALPGRCRAIRCSRLVAAGARGAAVASAGRLLAHACAWPLRHRAAAAVPHPGSVLERDQADTNCVIQCRIDSDPSAVHEILYDHYVMIFPEGIIRK